MLHYHHGGFWQIIEDNGELYFINGEKEKIKIINNYHLKQTKIDQ